MKKIYLFIAVFSLVGIGTIRAQNMNLHNFNDTAGSFPTGALTLSDGVLYGLTGTGGANNVGCIFSINVDGSSFHDMHDFSGNPADCDNPWGSLTLVGNMLYGMASNGGTASSTTDGSIFSIGTDGNNYKIRFNFGGLNIGFSPYGSLILSDTLLYGMAGGGPSSDGVVFSVDTAGNGYDTVMTFNGANGATPYGSLTLSGGVLYGMTSHGGANNSGCIFSVNTNGTGYRDMYDFSSGSYPNGSLVLSGGHLFGMTEYGGTYNYGNIFSIDTNGMGYRDLFDLNDTLGEYPKGDLTISGNKLFGMTSSGGANGQGNIFVLDTNGTGFTDLMDFNFADGANPAGDLILSGNVLYGMAYGGGVDSDGVIFKIDTNIATSVEELTAVAGAINLYPNPNNGNFTIALTVVPATVEPQAHIEIYNTLGQIIYQSSLSIGNLEISLPKPVQGVYLYRMVTTDGKLLAVGKFVLE